jgi:hypothetical protein
MRPSTRHPPVALSRVLADALGGRTRPVLVRGEILATPPRNSQPLALPHPLAPADAAVVRLDVEDIPRALLDGQFSRPERERIDRARDLLVADETGRLLVELVDRERTGGRLRDRIELHLDHPPSEHPLDRDPGETPKVGRLPAGTSARFARPRKVAWLRCLRPGDEVILFGVATTIEDVSGVGSGGYRDAPRLAVLAPSRGAPLHLFDRAAWDARTYRDSQAFWGRLRSLWPGRPDR